MTETYSINRDGIADLAITDPTIERWLADEATDEKRDEVERRINEQLAESGWDGDWSAEAIVREVCGL